MQLADETDDAGESARARHQRLPLTPDSEDAADADCQAVKPGALDSYVSSRTPVRLELASREHELVGAAVTANAEGRFPSWHGNRHSARQPRC